MPLPDCAYETPDGSPARPPGIERFVIQGRRFAADMHRHPHSLYAVKTADGKLFRIPITGTGAAGTVQEVPLDQPLVGPDGLKYCCPSAWSACPCPSR